MGDPIEVRALSRAYGDGRSENATLLIGSVKTNIGHLEAAAGVAGVIKTALCLAHGRLVPSLHARTLSPHIPWDEFLVAVTTEGRAWPENAARLAGVSSFGFSGTNAHVVLEAPPVVDAGPPSVPMPVHCLPVSARTPEALRQLCAKYAALLERGEALGVLAREAGRGRSHHALRVAVVAESAPVAAAALRAFAAGQAHSALMRSAEKKPPSSAGRAVFLFGDDAAVDERMAQALYDSAAEFREVIDEAEAVLGPDPSGRTLVARLRGGDAAGGDSAWSRAGALACQCAIARLWQRLGLTASGVVGQGKRGAIAASIISGSITLADGLRSALAQSVSEIRTTRHQEQATMVLGIGADPDALARAASERLAGFPFLAAYPGRSDPYALMRTLGTLYVGGAVLGWAAFGGTRSAIRLPTYPFERQRYWVALPAHSEVVAAATTAWPGTRLATATPVFEIWLTPSDAECGVMTAARLGELAVSGVRAAYGGTHWTAKELGLRHELAVPPSGRRVQLQLGDQDEGPVTFAIYSQGSDGSGGWQLHARGRLVPAEQASPALGRDGTDAPPVAPDELYYQVRWQAMPEAASATRALPPPSGVMPAARATYDHLVSLHRLDAFDRVFPLLHELSGRYAIAAFRNLGFDDSPGRTFSSADEMSRLRVVREHRRLFTRLLRILQEEGVLQQAGDHWRVLATLPVRSPDAAEVSHLTATGMAGDPVVLLRRCASRLADVLTGQQSPLALLFPNGSFAELNAIYAESPAARVHNGTLAAAACAAAAALPAGARLRIIEIGGGTASSTEAILAALPAEQVDYVFTDVSQVFLDRARERFPALRTGLLNVEHDPEAQGYEAARFDVVVAANVLHATGDLATTVRNCRRLLAPGGLLLCLEAVAPERWSDLTFGMTEGWWRFNDVALRPEHPLLPVARWRDVLAAAGLEDICTLGGEPGSPAALAQQALILAQAPRPARHWTLVGEGSALSTALAERLRQFGDAVQLRATSEEPTGLDGDIVYLGALALGPGASGEDCAALTCAHAARWLAALARHGGGKAWLVTAGAQPVAGGVGAAGRLQARLWGPGRVFALEAPGRWGGVVDGPADEGLDAQLEALLRTLAGGDDEDQVAYRAGGRHVPRLERASVPAAAPLTLDADATYLVIGGFGGLGLLVARWLAEQGARHIALLGRTPDMGSDDVRAIEAAGARVIPLTCDVADAAALREVLARLDREHPPLRGIVHAATAGSMAPIAELTLATAAAAFRSKVDGVLALESALPAPAWAGLDFVVLFSSTAALTGAAGMAAYAAANTFLDATAHGAGPRVLTVNWGLWEVIRASRSDVRALDTAGLRKLSSGRALQCLHDLIAAGARQMTVADIAWNRYKPLFEVARTRKLLANFAAEAKATARPERPAERGGPGPELGPERLDAFVRDTIAQTLGLSSRSEVALDAELFQLGMDSLMAMQVRAALASQIGVDLPLRDLLAPALTVGGLLEAILATAPGDELAEEEAEDVVWEEGVL